jgi:hypothetical protein
MGLYQIKKFLHNKGSNYQTQKTSSWVLVAHACNLSYSEGRDQEVHGSKPAQANSP